MARLPIGAVATALAFATASHGFSPAVGLTHGRTLPRNTEPNRSTRLRSSSDDAIASLTKAARGAAEGLKGSVEDALEDSNRYSASGDAINDFCMGTNEFWRRLVIKPVRDYVEIQPGGTARPDVLSKLIAPPEVPGIPRPVWLTILGSVPTALGWYGYYKFSVEEELFQYELRTEGKVTGCGGYGTLFPFVYGVIIGFPLSVLHVPVGEMILQAAGLWILLGQVNLYRRVNELCSEMPYDLGLNDGEPPLYEWWALLPPPLDVVVGLRQVHFLSEYWRVKRDDPYDKDVVAEELFPFISSPRFTLKQFFRTPSNWFWFTKDWKDFDFEFLKD
eukprot:CAMPEP_0183312218 /NCGR_PEP_ID=MMETSP0160_2-20130417/40732_1 /TAXON_ID=2839 ORGANISM="Odontella Sinensis, Strain Grunow 1884" /NCGR_SAMPLE_ID=MMETSP0160_2 /ASSEMBLY_ACC=CAM_ASM_000250 /LENGTH=332 /DNA_ID=CAMNT_0025477023 /DNA_START=25 /DNA_END=1023 /DNA_ORIENTATION=+